MPPTAGTGAARPPRARRTVAHLLVRAVLQQPGEQQVARLEEREILGVLHLPRGEQTGRLQVEQRRRDHQEFGGLIETHLRAQRAGVGDEVVRHLVQRDFRDVQLSLVDQGEEQVERSLEIPQRHPEAGLDRGRLILGVRYLGLRALGLRWSRNVLRIHHLPAGPVYDLACQSTVRLGAGRFRRQVVIGSPATEVSGKRTVRLITVS